MLLSTSIQIALIVVSIVTISQTADLINVITRKLYSDNPSWKMLSLLVDNTCHGAMSSLSYSIFYTLDHQRSSCSINYYLSSRKVIIAWIIGCLVDVDHFISAGSISIKAATNLPSSPLGHCIEFPLLMTGLILVFSRNIRWSILVFLSIFGHLLRDSCRRGLWSYYLGRTFPLSKGLMYCLYVIVPFSCWLIYRRSRSKQRNNETELDIHKADIKSTKNIIETIV